MKFCFDFWGEFNTGECFFFLFICMRFIVGWACTEYGKVMTNCCCDTETISKRKEEAIMII